MLQDSAARLSRQTSLASSQGTAASHMTPKSARKGAVFVDNAQPFEDLQLGPLLGQGSFGKVYRGMWSGAPVAVKVRLAAGLAVFVVGGEGGGSFVASQVAPGAKGCSRLGHQLLWLPWSALMLAAAAGAGDASPRFWCSALRLLVACVTGSSGRTCMDQHHQTSLLREQPGADAPLCQLQLLWCPARPGLYPR